MKFLTPSFLLLGCFVLGGIIFKVSTPHECGAILPDDSIFVLTGDARRIPFAMRQLRKYPDSDLYIIGAGATGSFEMARRVSIESDSKSTYQNALAIKKIANKSGLDRLVIITTEDHMNRARHLTRAELPNARIIACPVHLAGTPAAKRLERWTTEYIKYIVTLIGIRESFYKG